MKDPQEKSYQWSYQYDFIFIIITSSGDLQPSTAIANQSLGKSVSAN